MLACLVLLVPAVSHAQAAPASFAARLAGCWSSADGETLRFAPDASTATIEGYRTAGSPRTDPVPMTHVPADGRSCFAAPVGAGTGIRAYCVEWDSPRGAPTLLRMRSNHARMLRAGRHPLEVASRAALERCRTTP